MGVEDDRPIQSHGAHESGAGDLIAVDVVDLQAAGLGVAQDHVAGAAARKVAEAADLPIEADRAHEARAGDLIAVDVVDLDAAGVDVAQHHVGFAEPAEIAEGHDLPVHPDIAEEGGAGDVVADVVDLEAAGDRKSTRLNSSHSQISYAVFCLKKKKITTH